MKILNINDYKEDHNNMTFRALQACGFEIVNPQFDYNAGQMYQVFDLIISEFNKNFCDMLVGTGLGAFMAMCLSARKQVPCVLINPILAPGMLLPEMGYTKRDGVFYLSELECRYLPQVNTVGVCTVIDTQYKYLTLPMIKYVKTLIGGSRYCEVSGCTDEMLTNIFKQHKFEWFEDIFKYDMAL